MRDTAQDYRTYWIGNGNYYGKMRSLGAAAECQLPADKVAQIPQPDRQMVIDEAKGNPSFCAAIARCMGEANWQEKLARSAKEAIVNQMDPRRFPGSKGKWPKLRLKVDELVAAAHTSVKRALASMTPEQKLATARLVAGGAPAASISGLGDLGDLGFFDVLASLVTTVAKVGGDLYTADLMADSREDLAKIQANTAIRTATTNQAITSAQAAIEASRLQQAAIQSPVGAAISTLTTSTVAGVPVMLIAIPLIGVVVYLLTKK